MRRKNIISAVLSLTMLASTFTGLTVNAENNTSAVSEYSSKTMVYDDDFTGYDSGSIVTEDYNMTGGQTAIATHASGAKWVTSNVYVKDYKSHSAKFESGIYVLGAGESWTNVYLDLGENTESFEKLEMSVLGRKRVTGMSAFVSKDEKNMLVFGIGNENNNVKGIGKPGSEKPFVAILTNSDNAENLKIIQQPDAKFGIESVTYTVERLDNKTIKWTAKGETSGAESGGIITSDTARVSAEKTDPSLTAVYNENIESVISKAYYGMGVLSSGDGRAIAKSAYVQYTFKEQYPEPEIFDDFSSYNENNAVTTAYTMYDRKTNIAKGSNADGHEWKYVTSTKWNGYANWGTGCAYGKAYIDESKDALRVQGSGEKYYGNVKLDLGQHTVNALSRIQVKIAGADRMGMVNVLMNSSEERFLTFGLRADAKNPMGMSVKNSLPVVALGSPTTDPTRKIDWTVLASAVQNEDTEEWSYECAEGVTAVIDNDWTNSFTPTVWTLTFNADGSMSFIAEGDNGGEISGTIEANIVKPLMDIMQYPVSFMAAGDHASTFKDVKVWYSKAGNAPRLEDDFSDYEDEDICTEDVPYSNAKKNIAKSQSGAKWVSSIKYTANGMNHTAKFADGIRVKAIGNSWTNAYLDLGINKTVNKAEVITSGRKRANGISAFASKTEESMLVFGLWGSEKLTVDGLSVNGIDTGKPFAAVLNGRHTGPVPDPNNKGQYIEGLQTWQNSLYVVQQPDADGFSAAEPIKYTVERLDGKTVQWEAVGQLTGTTAGGIITSDKEKAEETDTSLSVVYNENIEKILENAYYGVGAFASGDGTTTATRVNVWYDNNEDEEPMFYDDFTYYADDDTITQNDVKQAVTERKQDGTETIKDVKGHRMADGAAVLGTHAESGAEWITSDVWNAVYASNGTTYYNGKAYINTEARGLAAWGVAERNISAVNLDMGKDKKFTDLHKITFTMSQPSRNAGVRLFVSGDEKHFIEFGYTGGEESRYGKDPQLDEDGNQIAGDDGKLQWSLRAPYSPMIRKSVGNGSANSIGSTTIGQMYAYNDMLVYDWDAYKNGTERKNCGRIYYR